MICCSPTASIDQLADCDWNQFAILTSPKQGVSGPVKGGWRWGGDNQAFTKPFDAEREREFFRWLQRMKPYIDTCMFVNSPDVPGNGRRTLALFEKHAWRIRELGFPIGLVGQDGMKSDKDGIYVEEEYDETDMALYMDDFPEDLDPDDDVAYWELRERWKYEAAGFRVEWWEFACFFVGGTTDWKISRGQYFRDRPVEQLIRDAKEEGKTVHGGRVNSWKRYAYYASLGADSFDGTHWIFGPEKAKEEIKSWQARQLVPPGQLSLFDQEEQQ